MDAGGDVLENKLRTDDFASRGQCHRATIPRGYAPRQVGRVEFPARRFPTIGVSTTRTTERPPCHPSPNPQFDALSAADSCADGPGWPDARRRHADTAAAPSARPPRHRRPHQCDAGRSRFADSPAHCVAAIVDPATRALVVLGGADAGAPDTLTVLGATGSRPAPSPCGHPATALTADGAGHVLVSTRGGYFGVDLAAGTAAAPVSPESRTPISPRSPGVPTASWCSAAPTARCSSLSSAAGGGASGQDLRPRGFHCHPRQYRRGAGPRADVGDRGGRRRPGPAGAARGRGRHHHGGRSGRPGAGRRHPRRRTAGVRRGPADHAPALPGSRGAVRAGRIAGLAWVSQTAANIVIGYDLATGIPVEKVRYPTVQQPNILAYRRRVRHVVCGVGVGCRRPGHRTRGGR